MKFSNYFLKGFGRRGCRQPVLDVRSGRFGAGHDEKNSGAKSKGGQACISLQRSGGGSLQGKDGGVRLDRSQDREAEALLPRQACEEIDRERRSARANAVLQGAPAKGVRQEMMTCATACPPDER
jgi:hypothetical protein